MSVGLLVELKQLSFSKLDIFLCISDILEFSNRLECVMLGLTILLHIMFILGLVSTNKI